MSRMNNSIHRFSFFVGAIMIGLSLVVRSVLLTVFYHPHELLPEREIA